MPHKLLLADDSVTIQRVIELTFADEDIQLTAVGDGKLAIERIEADPPDIVLADVGMPEKDGYEVAAFIKNNPRFAHIPVLLLTGAFEPVDEERARAVGCDGVLAKPFEPQMVITRVKELLAGAARPLPGHRAVPQPVVPIRVVPEPPAPNAYAPFNLDSLTMVPTALGRVEDPPGADEPFSIESALDAAVRIRRRQTMAVPEYGVPPSPPQNEPVAVDSDSSDVATLVPGRAVVLDDYFDRLDSSFATPIAPAPEPAAAAELDLTWAPPSPDVPARGGLVSDLDESPSELPTPVPGFDWSAVAPSAPVAAEPPAPAPAPVADVPTPAFANAFSALLAEESGEGDFGSLSYFGAPAPAPGPDLDELVRQVTRQVLDQMTDRVVRDTVTEIVSKVAERLVREEIERVKASIK